MEGATHAVKQTWGAVGEAYTNYFILQVKIFPNGGFLALAEIFLI